MDRSVPRRLVKRMGYNATAHGMRSTFADWCREVAKADAEARELALAHQIGNATTRAYARSDLLDPRRELMQRWADFLTG
jgi:integrase